MDPTTSKKENDLKEEQSSARIDNGKEETMHSCGTTTRHQKRPEISQARS